MYEPIRQLIRENRLRRAMHEMTQLKLSREHASRLVTLDRRLHIIEGKQIGNLAEERLLTIEENGLAHDMLVFLDQVEFPRRSDEHPQVAHSGAAAGAKKGKGKRIAVRLGIGAVVLTVLVLGVSYVLWPPDSDDPPRTPATEAQVTPAREMPTDELTYEERKKLALQAAEDEKRKEEQRQNDLKERERQQRIAEAKKLAEAEAANAYMTSGERVDLAIGVYTGQGNRTPFDESFSKGLSSFLGRTLNRSTSYEALTANFHNSKLRDQLFFDDVTADKRLSPRRARYLLLADVRSVDNEGKAQLRMCLYDTNTGKSLRRKETVDVGTGERMLDKYVIYAVRAFATEKLKL